MSNGSWYEPQRVDLVGAAGALAADYWRARDSRGVVAMLHGGGQTRHSWDRAVGNLVDRNWSVLTVDARGHGDSSWSAEGDYGIDGLVADTVLVAEQAQTLEGSDSLPVLVGASMGGMSSIVGQGEFGCARALVLVDITVRAAPGGVERISEFMRGAPQGFASLDEVAAAVSAYQPHRPRPSSTDGLRKNVRVGEDGRLYWHWDPCFTAPDSGLDDPVGNTYRLTAAAKRITVPTLLIRGEHSDVVTREGVQELRGLIPHAAVAHAQNAGHMVAGDDNAVFVAELGAFLDRLP
ncbi:alpha/beta fold hydrolase [Rhodococcoides fascians]|uniref:alpha/beta fold hydrolase n=1 Tax=Rhodococcoides fascians TaxID=1828 RepID=UPI0006904B17|nr:alpha/beta hydrolase [Rhodococcus fascians]